MVDALVSNVIKQLATIIQKEFELLVDVKKDVEKLFLTFTRIQVVLKDAEKRQIIEDPVRLWLQNLKDVSYDIDDVLDEWSTEILKSSLVEGVDDDVDDDDDGRISPTSREVCPDNLFSSCLECPANLFSSCFSFKQIGFRHDIGQRMKEINERLDFIASLQNTFGFIKTAKNDIIDEPKCLETSSVVDVSEVFGRDMDKDIIISKLISEGSSTQQDQMVSDHVPPMIISIVGMPGLGKTTLAQLTFNDERVKNHFDKRIWVHVSKPFDKKKVAMRIIEEIGGEGNNVVSQGGGGSGHHIAWEVVHRQLTTSIQGNQFLLILDDVWTEDRSLWDPLWLSLRCSSQGSRIIVTTRNERVTIMMGTTYVHSLGLLSDENCWSLLRRYAFDGRQDKECEKLKEIGMELAKKCNGLPLSAKTLGSLLRFKQSKQD
ncbi:putative disease resistance protein RGA3 [Macadamia integrifolia]|uniref:putative disease resistance protein RGA3 n=1 Tax=Macadamia integrifolia TaxID=60698 RepID=UPI001C502544|nr:putative disease resistance protein RGA3 [Macadamia integrifolia]